ncbi:MAG: protoheme IX farnesyltransferase [Deltaproteobacteria bacterium]|nr:protoheme IX farnesyltransferase [Deltaproteobacteria bacterium]
MSYEGDLQPGAAFAAPASAPNRASSLGALARDLVALAKPRITALVLITTAGGIHLAHGVLTARRSVLALLGTTLAVAAANALNCWWERDLDRFMERTRGRPLPAGRLSPSVALAFGLALALVSVPVLWLGVNTATGALGLLALVSYVGLYTPLKTRSPLALWVGAVPGALPPLMGWTTVTGRAEAPGLVLFAVLFLWQLPHFLAIGVFRREEYARAGFKILPLVRSEPVVRAHIVGWTLALVAVSVLLTPLGVVGRGCLVASLALGAWFLAATLSGDRATTTDRWARGVFKVSLGYLTALFAVIALDAR